MGQKDADYARVANLLNLSESVDSANPWVVQRDMNFQLITPLLLVGLGGGLCAQTAIVAAVPIFDTGFSAPVPGGSGFDASGGFGDSSELFLPSSFAVSTSSYYDSNRDLRGGTEDTPVEDDFVQAFSTSVRWSKDTSDWSLSISTSGNCELPLKAEDSISFGYGFTGLAAYHVGRLSLSGSLNQGFNKDSNRFYGGVVEQQSYGVSITGKYELSPKTSAVASFNASWTDGEGDVSSTGSNDFNLSAMWRYSPLLQIGPGVSYSQDSSDLLEARETIGPTVSVNYKLSSKVNLSGMLGWEFLDRGSESGGGGAPFLTTSLSASYQLNRLWGFSCSLNRGVQADGLAGSEYLENTAFGWAVHHQVGKVKTMLDLGLVQTSYQQTGNGPASAGIDYVTSSVSVSMPVMADQLAATIFIRYKDSMSDNIVQDWNAVQIGASFNYQF